MRPSPFVRPIRHALIALAAAAGTLLVHAQDYPQKPLNVE